MQQLKPDTVYAAVTKGSHELGTRLARETA